MVRKINNRLYKVNTYASAHIIEVDDNYQEFKTCTVHSLRHTFATRCIEKGVQPKTLQKMLGHSTIQVTMDLYVHVTDEYLENEVKKMNKAI